MVDGINWDIDLNSINPFNGKSVTQAEFNTIDTDGDGKLTKEEWMASSYFVSTTDKEGVVEIGKEQNTALIKAIKKENIPTLAQNITEFEDAMETVLDAYIELYYSENFTHAEEEKSQTEQLIRSLFIDFKKEYLKTNKTTPFNITQAALEFDTKIKESLEKRKAQQKINDETITGYQAETEMNLLSLFDLTIGANENGYISKIEFNKMKAVAVKYLMGMLLSEDFDDTLLKNLNKNYAKNSAFAKAKEAIDQLKRENNPEKIAQLLNDAQTALNQFVDTCGKDALASAAIETKNSQIENNSKNILDEFLSQYKEATITVNMTEEEKAYYDKFLSTCEAKFIAKIMESGEAETYTDVQLKENFQAYIQSQLLALIQEQTRAVSQTSDVIESYDKLVGISDKAKENGNISNEEKAKIVGAAIDFLMNQIQAGANDIEFFNSLGATNSPEISKIKANIAKIMSSVDPDEIQNLQEEARELLKTFLEKFTGQQLVNAVESLKTPEISQSSKEKAAFKSSIGASYETGESRTSSRGEQNEERLEEIQAMAKADLETYTETLKMQLKSELGATYNENEIQKYINDAINDTIALFTKNVSRKNGHGNYQTAADEQAFVFIRRSNTHKGKYVYNVKALIDTFVNCFNSTAKTKSKAKLDPSLATYDRENVIMEAMGNDYWRNEAITVKSSGRDDEAALAELIDKAKETLRKVSEQIKYDLKKEGLNIPNSVIDNYIEECIADTIKDMKNAMQYCNPGGKVTGGIAGGVASAGLTATGLAGGFTAAGVAAGSLFCTATAAAGTSVTAAATAAGLTSISTVTAGSTTFISAAGSSGAATAATVSSAVPVIGWCALGGIAAFTLLKNFTNIFGATYGKHNENAGFFFERKSNSHSGRFGYDTQTLVNTFMTKLDVKLAKWKQDEKNKGTAAQKIS